MKNRIAAAFAIAGILPVFAFRNQIQWDTSVTDGYFTDAANWTGVAAAPANPDETAVINLNGKTGDYIVRFPQGVTTNYAGIYTLHNSASSSLTIDTTAGALYQAPSVYASNWQGFGFFTEGNNHVFNFEGLGVNRERPICYFEGGQIKKWTDSSSRHHVDILSGYLNSYDPLGENASANQIILSGARESDITVHPQATLKLGKVTLRGGLFDILGGNHIFAGPVILGDSYSGRRPVMRIQSGVVEHGESVSLGNRITTPENRFIVTGDAVYTQSPNCSFTIGNSTNSWSSLDVGGDAKASVGKLYMTSVSVESGGELIGEAFSELNVTNNAELTIQGLSEIGYKKASVPAKFTIGDNAKVTANGTMSIARANAGSRGLLTVKDSGTFTTQSSLYIGALGKLSLEENAVYNVNYSLDIDGDGATMTVKDNASLKMDTSLPVCHKLTVKFGGRLELQGGSSDLTYLELANSTDSQTNVCIVSGGYHAGDMDESGRYVPLTVGQQDSHCLFEMTGGTMVLPRIVRVGYNTTGSGSAVMRMKGGFMDIVPENVTSGSCVLNVSDSTKSEGRLELLGGTIRAQSVRGWTGSLAKGGSGRAELYANGGTIQANTLSSEIVRYFDAAVLGENGLTVDTASVNTTIYQAFTDEEGKEGVFVKAGDGTLTVKMASSHSVTRVEGGVLNLDVAVFGKNLAIDNSGRLSFNESIGTLEMESLDVGSENSFGFVEIKGDQKLRITGDNGFNPVNMIVVADGKSAVGEYPLFEIAGEFDSSKLANIRFHQGDFANDYKFNAVENGDGTFTVKLKVEVKTVSETTWQGSSTEWNESSNWSGGSVPDRYNTAIFPAGASVKNVEIAGAAEVLGVKIEGGNYAFSGEGVLGMNLLDVVSGSLSIENTQKPVEKTILNIADGSSVAVNGELVSWNGNENFTKTGSGLLELNAASFSWGGSWKFNGGRTVVNSVNALGDAEESFKPDIVLGAGSLRFASGAETLVDKPVKADPGYGFVSIVEALSPVVFEKGLSVASGAFVKTGDKDVTVKYPVGTFALSTTNFSVIANQSVDGTVVFNENGDSPAAHRQFGGLTVNEGVLRLEGAGSSGTVINQKHSTVIGGQCVLENSAVLEVSGMTFQQGSSGIHLFVGGTLLSGSHATNSVLRVVDDGIVNADTIQVAKRGRASGVASIPVKHSIAVTNATVNAAFAVKIGMADTAMTGSLELGAGGKIAVAGNGGVNIEGGVAGEISSGGAISVTRGKSNGIFVSQFARGGFDFVDGGELQTTSFKSPNHLETTQPFVLNFNGGVLRFLGSGEYSMIAHNGLRHIETGAKGMEINLEGAIHTFAMPVRGEGKVAKTGAGELFLARCVNAGNPTNVWEEARTAGWSGLTEVKAGALTLEAGAARDDLKVDVSSGAELRIAGDQKIGAVSGAGRVTSSKLRSYPGNAEFSAIDESAAAARLSCTVDCDLSKEHSSNNVPVFENIDLDEVLVDFASGENVYDGDSDKLPIAKIGAGANASVASWRGVNRPPLTIALFTLEDGVVYANLRAEGLMLILK